MKIIRKKGENDKNAETLDTVTHTHTHTQSYFKR